MDDETSPDLLSDLPLSIIETILTLLPIRDAIKMSILSTKWRYRWANLPQLFFNDECVNYLSDNSKREQMLTKFITHALLLHKGPIVTFKISSSILQNCPDVDQWILFLSRNNVREIIIEFNEGEWFRVPSCIFSCKKLTHLELRGCSIVPPSSLKGFGFLRTLNLQPVLMESEAIERLIANCPVLECFTLLYYSDLDLSIYAPNLKYLHLGGELNELRVENSPLLKFMSITFYMGYDDDVREYMEKSSDCNFFKILGGVRDLERLVGHLYFTQYMSVGIDLWKPSLPFNHLTIIELYQVSFEDVKEIMVVLQLVINSPNLQELHISGSPNTTDAIDLPDQPEFLEIEYPSVFTFKWLKDVKMTDMCGMPLEMELIKILLENSPALEIMSITSCIYVTEIRLSMLLKLGKAARKKSGYFANKVQNQQEFVERRERTTGKADYCFRLC